ncbi:hypothetical protein HRbin39_01882 [bacterium HR39]|nr:hypothetical protein HRbin39_01882 [bacterium HR39]
MLGLGHGHAVARHDDDLLGILQQEGGVLRRALPDGLLALLRHRRARLAEAAEDHRDERAVHGAAHDVGEDGAGGADQRTGDDQAGVVQGEADARGRPSRVAVEHGDHHRHVGAADGDDEQHAKREGEQRHQGEDPAALGGHEDAEEHEDGNADGEVDGVAPGQQDRRRAHEQPEDVQDRTGDLLLDVLRKARLQLAPGDHRAGEGDGADDGAEPHLEERGDLDVTVGPQDVEVGRAQKRRSGDEHRGQTHQRVEGRHQLRHRRHLDAPGDHVADGAADGDANDDRHVGQHGGLRQARERHQDGERHAHHADGVARPRGLRVRQPPQRQDETDGRDQIAERGDVRVHRWRSLSCAF